jgi:hypothetical protein
MIISIGSSSKLKQYVLLPKCTSLGMDKKLPRNKGLVNVVTGVVSSTLIEDVDALVEVDVVVVDVVDDGDDDDDDEGIGTFAVGEVAATVVNDDDNSDDDTTGSAGEVDRELGEILNCAS